MNYTRKHKTVTIMDLSTLLITEKKLEDSFFFNLVQCVELSDLNEIVGLYLNQLPAYNLVQWERRI